MKRWIILLAISSTALGTTGCSMCCGPYDYDYPNLGGKHQRVDPTYGRVGSLFSDPNAGFAGPSADSNLEPQTELRDRSSEDSDDRNSDGLRFDDDLENIDPMPDDGPPPETLPGPDFDNNDTTASQRSKNRPRVVPTWR